MATSVTECVQHGVKSWIDYDRSWFFRRQFLMSQYHSSVMGNVVAVALTLAAPRLWILVKALFIWIYLSYKVPSKKSASAVTPNTLPLSSLPVQQPQPTYQNNPSHSHLPEHLAITEESRSELGAARDLLGNAWSQLTSRAIRLPIHDGIHRSLSLADSQTQTLWNNLGQHAVNIVSSLVLSIIFIGIFVAESSGSILSASIITDNVALSTFLDCKPQTRSIQQQQHDLFGVEALRPITYSDECYGADAAADGCNYFYNQSISSIEMSGDKCPFVGDVCLEGENSAYTLDTGRVDAKYLGINSAKRYQFRRSATCAPVVMEEYMKEGRTSDGRKTHSYYYGERHHFSPSSKDTWHTLNTEDSFTEPSFLVGSVCEAVNIRYGGVHPFRPLKEFKAKHGRVTLIFVSSRRLYHYAPRADPIFPAPYATKVPQLAILPTVLPQAEEPSTAYLPYKGAVYHANNTRAAVLGCTERTEICDVTLEKCWEPAPLPSRFQPGTVFSTSPHVPEATLASTLLYLALSRSSICISLLAPRPLDAQSKINGFMVTNLAEEQWKVEVRRLFQASLAHIQMAALNIARDTMGTFDYVDIPPNYRGMRRLVKFKTVGWRNVSVCGFCGLLLLAAVISLGSVKGGGDFWLIIGLRAMSRLFRWTVNQIPWHVAVPFARKLVKCLERGLNCKI